MTPTKGDLVEYWGQSHHDRNQGRSIRYDLRVGRATGRVDRKGRIEVEHGGTIVRAWRRWVRPENLRTAL